jgi:hypothetical protein
MFLRNSKQPTVRDTVRRIEYLRSWAPAAYLAPMADTWAPPTTTAVRTDW